MLRFHLSPILQTMPRSKIQNLFFSQMKPKSYKEGNVVEHRGGKKLRYLKKCRAAIVGLDGVGRSLAHLLKMSPGGLTDLHLCSRSESEGMAEELNHIPTNLGIQGFNGPITFREGLRGADIVVVTASSSRKQDGELEFMDNALICSEIMNLCADVCPDAMITIVTNPVDSLIPLAAGILKKRGVYRPEKLFGVCQLHQMRAQGFYAEAIGAELKETYVPVIGGNSESTAVPLFSKGRPNVHLPSHEMLNLVELVRNAGKKTERGNQSSVGSTYSTASAAMYFVHNLCNAIHHRPRLIISAYVESTVTRCKFFCNELVLGPIGVQRNLGYGRVTNLEQEMIDEAVATLQRQVAMAEDFVAKSAN